MGYSRKAAAEALQSHVDAARALMHVAAPVVVRGDLDPPEDAAALISQRGGGTGYDFEFADELFSALYTDAEFNEVVAHELAHTWFFPFQDSIEAAMGIAGRKKAKGWRRLWLSKEHEVIERVVQIVGPRMPRPAFRAKHRSD